MLAVGGMNELAPPRRAQTIEPHQSAHPVSAHGLPTLSHGRSQSTTTVGFVAGCKGRFEVDAGSTQRWLGQALLMHCDVGVVARAADLKDTAGLADCGGLWWSVVVK